jgi:transcriptional regulator with XRE-family HTH domain
MTDPILKINLAEWRRKAGMTQEELADALGVRQSQISAIENGKAYVSVQRLIRLRDILNEAGADCTLDDLAEFVHPETESALPVAS